MIDLRISPSGYEFRSDSEQARRLVEDHPDEDAAGTIRRVLSARPGWTRDRVEKRTRQILEGCDRLQSDVRGWLTPCFSTEAPFLDVGCGPGSLLAAAGNCDVHGLGVDISMVWLQVADRLLRERGARPRLAAALAEALPLGDAAVAGVTSYDVLEHVPDVPQYLREIRRVVRGGGAAAFTTPNRYSLAPEPHVGLWGVGWLPRRLQRRYVHWRIGEPYEAVCLRSAREIRRLFERHTDFAVDLTLPPIPAREIAHFPPIKARLAEAYNRAITFRAATPFLERFGAFFRVRATKT